MFLGDYHTHTVFSHGKGSIEDNVKQAVKMGLKEIAVTDHGFGHMAYGVRRRKWPQMQKQVEALRQKYPQINIYLGLENNFVSLGGDTDLKSGEEDMLDISVCGFHNFVKPASVGQAFSFSLPNVFYFTTGLCSKKQMVKNTDAYIKLVEKNKIDIVSHINYAIKADAVEVAKACKHFGTYVELNGKRINFTDSEMEKMAEEGVMFIADSDAHRPAAVGGFGVPIEAIERIHIPYGQIANWDKIPFFRSRKN